jgi:hypothetical protein
MIDIRLLTEAGAETSRNDYITGLLAEIRAYNALPAAPVQPKADALLRLCQVAGWYCTSKPPQEFKIGKPGGGKNQLRWIAITNLLEQVGVEVEALGLRMLSGPSDFKKIDKDKSSYWLELCDPQHRPGHNLAEKYANWLGDPNQKTPHTVIGKEKEQKGKYSFWKFIGTKDSPDLPNDFIVKYYPELTGKTAEFGADKGMLHFDGGQIKDVAGNTWSTENLTTHFSGQGWGIFVVCPQGRMYGGSHEAGKHHHSSFLAGGMVKAAGEIACDKTGIPRIITSKSGHYRPTWQNLREFVTLFSQIPGNCLILPKSNATFYRVSDFRLNGLGAKPVKKAAVQMWMHINKFAFSTAAPNGDGGFKKIFDKITD